MRQACRGLRGGASRGSGGMEMGEAFRSSPLYRPSTRTKTQFALPQRGSVDDNSGLGHWHSPHPSPSLPLRHSSFSRITMTNTRIPEIPTEGYQTGLTILGALRNIQENRYVLPAIQRELVWSAEQMCTFFDSLMRDYPFGTFLFWQTRSAVTEWQFYGFLQHYHERDARLCLPVSPLTDGEYTAILDGQQRLTALNIGLRGSRADRKAHGWWRNDDSFHQKFLYLDLLCEFGEAHTDDSGKKYDFRFLTKEEAKSLTAGHDSIWFLLSDILEMNQPVHVHEWVTRQEINNSIHIQTALKTLSQLQNVVHFRPCMAYYEVRGSDFERVLNIFIRTNSGGTPLSNSDLLLSVATAHWIRDARSAVNGLVKRINQHFDGSTLSRDLVLRAGLVLCDENVRFRVTSFRRKSLAKIEENWEKIADTLDTAARLVASFGFSQIRLPSENAVLPIAYYLYRRDVGDRYLLSAENAGDREAIRRWLLTSFLSGVWRGSSDTVITRLRETISHEFVRLGNDSLFPERALKTVGRSWDLTPDVIEQLVDTEYGPLAYSLLSLIFPSSVAVPQKVDMDHVFPKSGFYKRKMQEARLDEEQKVAVLDHMNRLPNLQLLGAFKNRHEKKALLPREWLDLEFGAPNTCNEQKNNYLSLHDLGAYSDVPQTIAGFEKFYFQRRARLVERVREMLGRGEGSGAY